MSTLTAINMPGVYGLQGDKKPELLKLVKGIDPSVSVSIKPSRAEAWLVLDYDGPFDPTPVIEELIRDVGVTPTNRVEVTYERTGDGKRRAARDGWKSHMGYLPDMLKDEFIWYGPADGRWEQQRYSNSSSRSADDGQHNLNVMLEPLLYHKLNVAALENGQSLDEYIMEVLEERADG